MSSAILGFAAVLIAALYGYGISQIPALAIGDPLGPRAFPTLLLAALLVIAAFLLAAGIPDRHWREQATAFMEFVRTDLRVVGSAAVWLGLYYLAFEPLGYLLSTAVFLSALTLMAHQGRRWAGLVTALSFSVISYFVFTRLFDVPLPRGILSV
jgi:putative tricarboxylic transport membrane protein